MPDALVRERSVRVRFSSRAAAVMAILLSALGTQAAAAAPSDAFTSSEPCVVRTLPEKFIELSTTGSVADVVEVSCETSLAGCPGTFSDQQLRNRCNGHLSWVLPYPYESTSVEAIEVRLDADANATVALFADTWSRGASLVDSPLEREPLYTARASFDVLAPKEAPEGVTVIPESEVPNFTHKSIAVVVPVTFEADQASQQVKVSSQELFSGCAVTVVWVGPGASVRAAAHRAPRFNWITTDGGSSPPSPVNVQRMKICSPSSLKARRLRASPPSSQLRNRRRARRARELRRLHLTMVPSQEDRRLPSPAPTSVVQLAFNLEALKGPASNLTPTRRSKPLRR